MLRVTPYSTCVLMRINLPKYFGQDVSKEFKCSDRWMARFKGRWGISCRRRTETKNERMELKLPCVVRRWHARLRLRLKRGAQQHAIWGRWLPENRVNVKLPPNYLRRYIYVSNVRGLDFLDSTIRTEMYVK